MLPEQYWMLFAARLLFISVVQYHLEIVHLSFVCITFTVLFARLVLTAFCSSSCVDCFSTTIPGVLYCGMDAFTMDLHM